MPVYAFPKSSRLLRAEDFTAVLRGPDVNLSSGPLRIRARKNRMRSARLGLVVSKKGNPTAVRRNRIKRIVREQFRQYAHLLPAADIVIQVFGQLDDDQLEELLKSRFSDIRQYFDHQVWQGE